MTRSISKSSVPGSWKRTRFGVASQESVVARYPDVREPELHKIIIRDIIDVQVRDVIATSADAIANAGVRSADEVRRQAAPLDFL